MLKNFQVSKYSLIQFIKINFFLIVPFILFGQNKLIVGIEKTDLYFPYIENKNIAVVSNHTSKFYINNKKIHLVDSLINQGFNIQKVFAPEHGFRGNSDAGEKIINSIISKSKASKKKISKVEAERLIKEQNEKDLKEVKQANKSTSEIKTKKADISKKSPQVKKKTAKKVSKK